MLLPLNVRWADADLLGVEFSYDQVVLRIRESQGQVVTVVGTGPIGLNIAGFWDEAIIETATVVDDHPFADDCLGALRARLGPELPPSGSPDRNRGAFLTLVISLIDGSAVACVAARFEAERNGVGT